MIDKLLSYHVRLWYWHRQTQTCRFKLSHLSTDWQVCRLLYLTHHWSDLTTPDWTMALNTDRFGDRIGIMKVLTIVSWSWLIPTLGFLITKSPLLFPGIWDHYLWFYWLFLLQRWKGWSLSLMCYNLSHSFLPLGSLYHFGCYSSIRKSKEDCKDKDNFIILIGQLWIN